MHSFNSYYLIPFVMNNEQMEQGSKVLLITEMKKTPHFWIGKCCDEKIIYIIQNKSSILNL